MELAPSMVDQHSKRLAHQPLSSTVGPRKRGIIEAYSMGKDLPPMGFGCDRSGRARLRYEAIGEA